MSTPDAIRAAIEPELAPHSLVVADITVTPAGKRRVVRVLVDTDISTLASNDTSSRVGSPSLDAVADAARTVSDVLDAGDVMGQAPYVLEVSSPGVGRPLRTPAEFRRQVGRLVELSHPGGTSTGRLVDVSATELTLDIPAEKKTPGRTLCLPIDEAVRGTVQVEFKRNDPDGSPPEHEEEN